MRLPWAKIYRAFPELDTFSDEECERYVLQVQAQRKTRGWPQLAGLGAGLAWPVLMVLVGIALRRVFWVRMNGEVLAFVLPIGEVVAVGMAILLTRDALLIRAIRRRIDNARCTRCGQSLLGLPLLAGPEAAGGAAVRCPECGEVMRLVLLGLVPGDLIPLEQRGERDAAGV